MGVVVLLGVLTALAPVLHPEPVSAASGVDDYPSRLKKAPKDSLVDPWRFYNRECTSFVAWRLNSENQVAFDDYWQGQHWGNASHWKAAASALGIPVDNKPTRGAVAWWSAGSAGSSVGHVAWVETVGDGAITIEEYNYLHSGGYDTRMISRSSSLWPSGFIHIKDTQIRNTTAPTVTGAAQVGQKLRVTRGTWSLKHLTFSYQWFADGKKIKGATKQKFTPTAAQLGTQLQAKVTAAKSGAHSGTAKSHATGSVAKGVFVNTAAPTVTGKAQVGIPLAADRGTWSPAGTFTYQWYAAGQPIDAATGASFTPTADQLGSGLKVRVSLSAPGYKTKRVKSAVTAQVSPGQFTAKTPPTVSGVAQVDKTLTASAGTWSPAGKTSYQWLAGGKAIKGATGTAYSPTADVLRKAIAVRVTVHQRGYDDAVATSVATTAVAPGTFLNTTAPSIPGTPQVGVPLTAKPGRWSPGATVSYQWLVDGERVPHATKQTFTPRPQDVRKKITVAVTAARPGYLTATAASPATPATSPGAMHNRKVPTITGRAVAGHILRATNGTWTIKPDAFRYQWYADGTRIKGATAATFKPTAALAGQRIRVEVLAHHMGYTSVRASSASTDPVVLGRVAFAKPTIRGKTLVGHTVRARIADVEPSAAVSHYRWYRGSTPIHGAREASYVVRPADLGHRLHVVVTMHAQNWTPRARRSIGVKVSTHPRVHAHTSMREGRVLLRLRVTALGIDGPDGRARVWLGARRLARFTVADGHGAQRLARLKVGTHTLTVVYRGGPHETVARKTITVTVP